ncbi:MAG: alanine racemase [Spirochaetia bacterium]|nr:alanine racemase [Spirochaetia bacterium]
MHTLSLNKTAYPFKENRYPVLEISEKALNDNFGLIKKITGSNVKILIPVKANAYGCGISEMMPFFQKVKPEYLGVANPYEGYLVRQYGWKGKILNMGGFFDETADYFTDYDIIPSITDLWQIETLNQIAKRNDKQTEIHIKLDCGMGRIGILPEDVSAMISLLKESVNLKVTGIFTHFPSSNDIDAESNKKIMINFMEYSGKIIDTLKLVRREVVLHSANSYSVMLNPDSHLDMVRPGLCFYGYFYNTSDRDHLYAEFPFEPCLSLTANPISIRHLPQGHNISYGETCHVTDDSLSVGVLPLGYADGIPRHLSNNISFQGHPLLGRVTMDQIIIGGLTRLSDSVKLLGTGSPPLERWADLASTVSYEIMVRFGERIQRKLILDGSIT